MFSYILPIKPISQSFFDGPHISREGHIGTVVWDQFQIYRFHEHVCFIHIIDQVQTTEDSVWFVLVTPSLLQILLLER